MYSNARLRDADFRNRPDSNSLRKLKKVRKGNMRLYFDRASGELQEAYSYDACIFTRLPCSGRGVINLTRYGVTSASHLRKVLAQLPDCHPWRSYGRDYIEIQDVASG